MSATRFFLVSAPGYYGDRTRVLSSHATLEAARRAARGLDVCIRVGELTKGAEWLRVYEQFYQQVCVDPREEAVSE